MQSMPSCIISSNCIYRRFVVPTCIKIPKCGKNNLQATTLFLLSVGFYVAVARILFLLLFLVWQQQDFFSYCWFLCGSSKDSFLTAGSCVAVARLPIVGSYVTTIRYHLIIFRLGQLGWWDVGRNLKWMPMNNEMLELSGKWWELMDIKCYIENGNG